MEERVGENTGRDRLVTVPARSKGDFAFRPGRTGQFGPICRSLRDAKRPRARKRSYDPPRPPRSQTSVIASNYSHNDEIAS